jgi:hypothetical protein
MDVQWLYVLVVPWMSKNNILLTSIIHPSIDILSRKVIFFEDVEFLLVFTKNISRKGAILEIPLGRKIVSKFYLPSDMIWMRRNFVF